MIESLKKLYRHIQREQNQIIILAIVTLIMVILSVYLPKVFTSAIDLIKDKDNVNIEAVKSILNKSLLVILLISIFKWYTHSLSNDIAVNVAKNIRNQCIKKLNNVNIKFIDNNSNGDITNRIITETDKMSHGLFLTLNQVLAGIFTIIFTIIFMLSINVTISLLIIILTPLSIVVTYFISLKTEMLYNTQNKSEAKLANYISEMTYDQKDSIAYNRQSKNIKQFNKLNSMNMTDQERALFYSSIINPSTRLINNLVYALIVFLGANACLSGSLTIGGLACLITYIFQYTKPFNEISTVYPEIISAITCIERIDEIIDQADQKNSGEEKPGYSKGNIVFEDVAFSYNKKPFIEDINIEIKAGEKVALVGPTGCGKTTLVNLLLRFYKFKEGIITIDGTSIRKMDLVSLRKLFGVVLQDSWILNGSVRENLIVGNTKLTDEEIIEACKKTELYPFIQRLPNGLSTVISNESGLLSEGVKQLISITRVMLSNPNILILDEATSELDSVTEQKVQKALETLMKDKTCFIIAHRLSTITSCDKIFVMSNGRIVEKGTHAELMKLDGFYETLYSSQY